MQLSEKSFSADFRQNKHFYHFFSGRRQVLMTALCINSEYKFVVNIERDTQSVESRCGRKRTTSDGEGDGGGEQRVVGHMGRDSSSRAGGTADVSRSAGRSGAQVKPNASLTGRLRLAIGRRNLTTCNSHNSATVPAHPRNSIHPFRFMFYYNMCDAAAFYLIFKF